MKPFQRFLLLLAAIVLTTTVQAQVINGDLNHNGDLDVDDVTLLIDGYLTGETEAIKSTVNPYMVDNSLIAGTWLSDKGQLTFHEDGSLGGFYEGLGYTYKFMPFQKHILLYYDSGKFVAEMKVLELTDETMSLLYEGTYGTYTRIQAVDLGLSVEWANMNIGANAPEDYGDYFAWGETEPKDYYDWETYKWCKGSKNTLTKYCTDPDWGTVDDKTTLELEDDAAHVNWGGTWRMPTIAELTELEEMCSWEWTTQNGVNGNKVTGPNGNSIFLPAAGYSVADNLLSAGDYVNYWSSSLNLDDDDYAYLLYFDSDGSFWFNFGNRYLGRPVRAVCPTIISLSETSLVLKSGKTVQLTATVEPVDAGTVTWTSNDESVATVADGFVTAIAEGTAVITAEVAGVQATCSVTVTNHEYVDLGLSVKWATMNVGANAPEEYGDYFAWGETEPKDNYNWLTYKWCRGSYDTMTKYCTSSKYGSVDNKTVLDLEDDAARANWGGTWRMPTVDEIKELVKNCSWKWTTQSGVNGLKLTGPNGNSIFLPAAGSRSYDGLSWAGYYGYYWSSSLSPDDDDCANLLIFGSGGSNWDNNDRSKGRSVRAVCP